MCSCLRSKGDVPLRHWLQDLPLLKRLRLECGLVLALCLFGSNLCVAGDSNSVDLKASLEEPQAQVSLYPDLSAARTVIEFLGGDQGLPPGFESNAGVHLLIKGNARRDSTLSAEFYVAALESCRTGICRDTDALSLDSVMERLEQLSQFLYELERNEKQLSEKVSRSVLDHIPRSNIRCSFPVYLVLGGKSDYYVEFLDGEPVLVFELSSLVQDSIEESWTMFHAAADHELWHAVFLKYVESNWRIRRPLEVQDLDYRFTFMMLNEGYAHYLSILAFTGSNDLTLRVLREKGRASVEGFFDQFSVRFADFVALPDGDAKAQRLRESHIGNMWSKWGAMTGALVIATLHSGLEAREVLELIENEPYSIWLRYQELAGEHGLPAEFIRFVKHLRAREIAGEFDQ
jgi:hypothetical protein